MLEVRLKIMKAINLIVIQMRGDYWYTDNVCDLERSYEENMYAMGVVLMTVVYRADNRKQ